MRRLPLFAALALLSSCAGGTEVVTRPWSPRLVLRPHEGEVQAVAFSPDGKTVISAGPNPETGLARIRLWAVDSGMERVSYSARLDRVAEDFRWPAQSSRPGRGAGRQTPCRKPP